MQATSATGGAYGLGIMPTGGHQSAWRAFTQAITTSCGRAWGHGGAFPGYYQLPISSPDGSRQAVLLVNTEEAPLSLTQFKQVYNVLATALLAAASRRSRQENEPGRGRRHAAMRGNRRSQ